MLREVGHERLGARVGEHPSHFRFQHFGLGEPTGDRVVEQRVVRNAVPEEQREPGRQRDAVVSAVAFGGRVVLGQAVIEEKLGTAQDSREPDLDAGLEVAAVVAAARVELAQASGRSRSFNGRP